MTYNPITYTASGGQTVFNIPFTRISDTYIRVATKLVAATNYITKSVSTDYTIVGNTVVFNIGLAVGVKVRIWRSTNRTSLVDFNGVNNLTSSNLGLTTTQQSNIAEEVEADLDELNAVVDGIVTSVIGFDPDNVSSAYLELQGDVSAAVADFAAQTATVTALDIVKNPTVTANALKIPRVNAGATAYEAVTFDAITPSQAGNSGKLLTTNGTNASWLINTGAFAWVNFAGTTSADLAGTFTRTLQIVTVNATAHGHQVGHRIFFVGAGVTSGIYTVASVVNANSFTFDSGVSGTIGSTACTLQRRAIRGSLNVANVAYIGAGDFIINLINALPDTNYAIATGVGGTGAGRACTLTEDIYSNTRFTNNLRVNTGGASAYANFEFNHVAILR